MTEQGMAHVIMCRISENAELDHERTLKRIFQLVLKCQQHITLIAIIMREEGWEKRGIKFTAIPFIEAFEALEDIHELMRDLVTDDKLPANFVTWDTVLLLENTVEVLEMLWDALNDITSPQDMTTEQYLLLSRLFLAAIGTYSLVQVAKDKDNFPELIKPVMQDD